MVSGVFGNLNYRYEFETHKQTVVKAMKLVISTREAFLRSLLKTGTKAGIRAEAWPTWNVQSSISDFSVANSCPTFFFPSNSYFLHN